MKPKIFISSFNKIPHFKTTTRNKINKKPLIHSASSNNFKINKNQLTFKKNFSNLFGKTKERYNKFSKLREKTYKISESKEEENIDYHESIPSEDDNNDKLTKKSNDTNKKIKSDNSEIDIEEETINKDKINLSKFDFDEESKKDKSYSEENSSVSNEERNKEEENSQKSKISNEEIEEELSYLSKKEKSIMITESDNKSQKNNSIRTEEKEEEDKEIEENKTDEDKDSQEESFPDYDHSDEKQYSDKSNESNNEEKEEEEDDDNNNNDTKSSMTKITKHRKHKKTKISSDYSSSNTSSEDEYHEEPINKLYNKLCKNGLTNSISKIYDKNQKIIGKRILKLEKDLDFSKLNWIKAYHGTKYNYLESIITNGLKKPGEIIFNDKKVKPRKGHIDFGKTVYNIKNWAKAIFVSPSIYYSSCPCYSEKIKSNGKKWRVLVEVKVKPDSFECYDSTIGNYHFLKNEPEKVEYRIDEKENVYVYAILFIKDNFMKKSKRYQDGFIFY